MEQSKNIVDSCHFFYFPLQLFTESRTTIISPECFEQAFYVESASKSLPEGCKLLVKEHPDWVGEFPLGTYRRIKKLKNVIMINPKMLPKELIHKSDGVITINGSVGYEGILLGKPVTAFGKEYYTGLNLTQDVSDLTKLGFVLKNTTHNTHEDVLHFINLVYCNTGKGIFGLYQEKNVDDFVSSLDSYIKTKQMSN
jgi:capsule polysaccharide modification protein KpsS